MATVAQKWMEKGIEQGRQQGLQQGLREGMIKALVALLRARFAPDEAWLEALAAQLRTVENLEQLEALHVTAAQVQSLDEFQRALEGSI